MKNKWVIPLIALTQIVGATTQVASIAWTSAEASRYPSNLGIVAIMLSIYLIAFLSGVYLWKRKRIGYIGAILTQAAQVPVIVSHSLMYKLVFGVGVLFGYDSVESTAVPIVIFGFESAMYVNNDVVAPAAYINVVGIIAALIVYRELMARQK